MTRRAPQPSPAPALALAAAFLVLALAACGGGGGGDEQATPAAQPTRLESPELGLAVEVPASSSFTAAGTEGGVLRLRSDGETAGDVGLGPATLVYAAEPPQQAGVNLVEAVNQRKAELEARPAGQFYGQTELGTHLGPAYSTRGSYADETGEPVEEIRIFAVHPAGDRLLHMTLAYDPVQGQAPARVEQAMEAFGWIEPLPVEAQAYEGGTEAGEMSESF